MKTAFSMFIVATALIIGYVAGAVMAEGDKLDRAVARVHREMATEIVAGRPFKLAGSDIKIWPIKDRPKSVRARLVSPLLITSAAGNRHD